METRGCVIFFLSGAPDTVGFCDCNSNGCVQAYTMAPHAQKIRVLRVLCREDFSMQSAESFVDDLKQALSWLDGHFIYTAQQLKALQTSMKWKGVARRAVKARWLRVCCKALAASTALKGTGQVWKRGEEKRMLCCWAWQLHTPAAGSCKVQPKPAVERMYACAMFVLSMFFYPVACECVAGNHKA